MGVMRSYAICNLLVGHLYLNRIILQAELGMGKRDVLCSRHFLWELLAREGSGFEAPENGKGMPLCAYCS